MHAAAINREQGWDVREDTLVFPICHSVSGRFSDRSILATACFGSLGRGFGSLAARQLYFPKKSFAFTCTG